MNIGGQRRKLIRALQAVKTEDKVIDLLDGLFAMLRHLRLDQKLAKVIGKDYTAITIGRDYESGAYFYGSTNAAVRRYPHIIC